MSLPIQNVCLPDYTFLSNDIENTATETNPNVDTLLALDHQLNELGLSRSEFYSKLRHNNNSCRTKLRAHFDGGSMATTTNQLHYLWYYRSFEPNEHPQALQVADRNCHQPTGTGFLRIPILQRAEQTTCLVQCLYTPTLPATIVLPFDLGIQYRCNGYSCASKFSGSACTVRLHFCPTEHQDDLCFPQILHRGLLFSEPLLFPEPNQHSDPVPSDIPNFSSTTSTIPLHIRQITREQQRILWHQRLGHIHPRRISQAHKYADGIPVIANANNLEKCPICARAKLYKAARGTTISRRATTCFQGISIDFGFIVQTSNADSTQVKKLQSMHGETCYCLLVDHYSGMLFGQCFRSKAPPLEFLQQWLSTYGLSNAIPDRYV
jgi:hypothetical protein